MRLPNRIASKYSKNALGDDPRSSAAKSWATDSMNIGDATYADAPMRPRIDRPINPVAKMICREASNPARHHVGTSVKTSRTAWATYRDPQTIE
jgi:hypothetical protein